DEIAERRLRVVGDADRHRAVRFGTQPFVRVGVFESFRYIHRTLRQQVVGNCEGASTTPWRTNGGLTTRASSMRPRTSTRTLSPSSTAAGTRPKAIDCFIVGEKVPLVISPSP